MLRQELRCWAEPLVVQRWADYKAERGDMAFRLAAAGDGHGQGARAARARRQASCWRCSMRSSAATAKRRCCRPNSRPPPRALVGRLGETCSPCRSKRLGAAGRIAFRAEATRTSPPLPISRGEDPVVVTRFGIAHGRAQARVRRHSLSGRGAQAAHAALAAKVHGAEVEVEPEWRSGLTRAVMGVQLPGPLGAGRAGRPARPLLDLKAGDVIPIDFGAEVPVMVAERRLGTGLVGTANGRAAVRLTQLEPLTEEDFR
jgi:flagellar motor switch protein FliM